MHDTRPDDGSVRNTTEPAAAVDAGKPRPPTAPLRDAQVEPLDARPATSAPDAAVPTDAGLATGDVPCQLRDVLAKHCWACHGTEPKFGAPMSLVSWQDLQRASPSDPALSTSQHVLARIGDDARPMPPAPQTRLTSAEQEVVRAWVQAGAPKTSAACGPPESATETPTAEPKPEDCEQTYELRAHGAEAPDDETKYTVASHLDDSKYRCFYFDPPFADDSSLFWYEPILDNVKHLHHWILYSTDDKQHASGTSSLCNSADPGWRFVAGWGPGTSNVLMPRDVGLLLQTGPKAGLVLEVHYSNDTDVAQQDASGVRFCTGARTKRPHQASVHGTGTEGICIEPGSKRQVSGTCSPRTDMGDIHLTGIWPHMHKRGRHMTVTVNRKAGGTEVFHDAPFDFNAQLYYPKDELVVHPGDTLETRCSYENDTTERAHFGERTSDEMCYGFITAWPAGSLVNSGGTLGSDRSDLTTRCADPFSVLQSCNGLGDAL